MYSLSRSLIKRRLRSLAITTSLHLRICVIAKPVQNRCTGLTTFQFAGSEPDHRFDGLPLKGPFQITRFAAYHSALGNPMHRFFQMWQRNRRSHGRQSWSAWREDGFLPPPPPPYHLIRRRKRLSAYSGLPYYPKLSLTKLE